MDSENYGQALTASFSNRERAAENLISFVRASGFGFREPSKSDALAIVELIANSDILERARPYPATDQTSTTKPKS
jgi:hypothetical protein